MSESFEIEKNVLIRVHEVVPSLRVLPVMTSRNLYKSFDYTSVVGSQIERE